MHRVARGFFRLWIVVSIAWLCAVAWVMWPGVPIAWPWSGSPIIQVKYSDTETWTYPAAWGVERIRNDAKQKMAERTAKQAEEDRQWAASIPAERKTFCAAFKTTTATDRVPDDCGRLAWIEFPLPFGELTGWESQFRSLPVPIGQVASQIGPPMIGPPLFLLIVGLALGWAAKGFRHG
jgi:hypothetical protein